MSSMKTAIDLDLDNRCYYRPAYTLIQACICKDPEKYIKKLDAELIKMQDVLKFYKPYLKTTYVLRGIQNWLDSENEKIMRISDMLGSKCVEDEIEYLPEDEVMWGSIPTYSQINKKVILPVVKEIKELRFKSSEKYVKELRMSVLKRMVTGMANDRKSVIKAVTGLSKQIVNHILKICLYTDKRDYENHWTGELNAFLRKCNKYKLEPDNKKLPKADFEKIFFREEFFSNPEELDIKVKNIIKNRKSERLESRYTLKYNPESAYKEIRALIETIIEDLSKGTFENFNKYQLPSEDSLTKEPEE